MAEAFEISSVNANPARFDIKKCTSINGDWIRTLAPDDLAARIVPYLIEAQVLPLPPTDEQLDVLRAAVPHISERMETLGQAAGMVGFLFAGEPGCKPFEVDPDDAAKILDDQGIATLEAARSSLESLESWTTEDIEFALRRALIDGSASNLGSAFGPVRVAITGRRSRRRCSNQWNYSAANDLWSGWPWSATRSKPDARDEAKSEADMIVRLLGYGVIGSTTDSGSVSLGSSPGTPASSF